MSAGTVAIVGAGPAGLTAALVLARAGVRVDVYESGERVGGLARTGVHGGFRYDIGGHRFYTRAPSVQRLWEDALGPDLLRVRRLSRIHYDGRFFAYPLRLPDVLSQLGPAESARIAFSYARAQLWPAVPEETFEQWVTNRFGDRLYRTFFKAYTEKVWGLPCTVIRADWAAQRIQGLSLARAAGHALFGRGHTRSLAGEFDYPRLGPGQMWERFASLVEEAGGRVHLRSAVRAIHHRDGLAHAITVDHGGLQRDVPTSHVVSSAALPSLVASLDPAPPAAVREAAAALRYRDFVLVVLVVARRDVFRDNWIYVHTPAVRVGRIQNFKNWSAALVPDPALTSLGMEYFCSAGDETWSLGDRELVSLAAAELEALGLAPGNAVVDGWVVRQRGAYPVYDEHYQRHLATIRAYLAPWRNLQTVGRNGTHRYNNQDHSMLSGEAAARRALGAADDPWDVNTERSYYEEQVIPERRAV